MYLFVLLNRRMHFNALLVRMQAHMCLQIMMIFPAWLRTQGTSSTHNLVTKPKLALTPCQRHWWRLQHKIQKLHKLQIPKACKKTEYIRLQGTKKQNDHMRKGHIAADCIIFMCIANLYFANILELTWFARLPLQQDAASFFMWAMKCSPE